MNKITYCNLIPKDCEVMKLDMPDGNISLLLAEQNNGDVVHLLLNPQQWEDLRQIAFEVMD